MKTSRRPKKMLLLRAVHLGALCLLALVITAPGAWAQVDGYVVENGALRVLDSATGTTIGGVSGLPIPREVTASPDGSFAYVTIANGVVAIDTLTFDVLATVPTGNIPIGVVFTPDGAIAYVGNNASATVSVVDTATHTVIKTLAPINLSSIAITPDGGSVWLGQGSSSGASIVVIDTATNTVSTTFATGHSVAGAFGIDFTSDGAYAYTANSDNTVSVFDTATLAEVATVAAGPIPFSIALTPDDAYAYVVNLAGNSVSVIDTAAEAVVATVPVGSLPRDVGITPDGAFAWVSNWNSSTISVIDTATQTVASTLPVGPRPWGIDFMPDSDLDGVGEIYDNCPFAPNPDQADFDDDGYGDACDDDVDGDGVPNDADLCPSTDPDELVEPGTGCSIAQLCPCAGPAWNAEPWKNHGQYVSCVSRVAQSFARQGLITGAEKGGVVSDAARSSCGK